MRRRFALFAFVAFAISAPAFASDRAKIDRLMQIFHVRELSAKAIQGIFSSEAAMKMSTQQRECMARVFSVDAFTDEMRGHYSTLFQDEAVADQTIAYFSSPSGKRLLEAMLAGRAAGELPKVIRSFTPAEMKAMDTFAASPAGLQFQSMGQRLKPLQEATMRKISQRATSNCGSPQREQH